MVGIILGTMFMLWIFYLLRDKQPTVKTRDHVPFHSDVDDIELPTKISGKYMSSLDKQNHLMSSKWKLLKFKRLSIANHQCEHCCTIANLELHHVTYQRLGDENIDDVAILCRICHQELHDIADKYYENKYGRENIYPLSLLSEEK